VKKILLPIAVALAFSSCASAATLVAPAIGLHVEVGSRLSAGPVVWFHDADTLAIAGHRTTHTAPFRHLDRMRLGALVTFAGKRYRVAHVTQVRPWETWPTRWSGLVLSACTPPGSDRYRLVVHAREVTP
jgi:hypothetical protein